IDDLCNTEYNWGVPGGVPSNVAVAHKVGFNTTYYANNDVGIVFGTEDYVLAVMTESGNAQTAQQIIGEVSKMVYDYVESNYA
ncbi:MAG: serine hydrolase, partial [Clostridiales bacterium]|nr:serine hydrolase [Clostridiales bacterium]